MMCRSSGLRSPKSRASDWPAVASASVTPPKDERSLSSSGSNGLGTATYVVIFGNFGATSATNGAYTRSWTRPTRSALSNRYSSSPAT